MGFREGILKRRLRYGAEEMVAMGEPIESERLEATVKVLCRIAVGDGVSQELELFG